MSVLQIAPRESLPASTGGPAGWISRTLEVIALCAFCVMFIVVPDGADAWVLWVNLIAFYALLGRALWRPDRVVPTVPTYFTVEVLFLVFSYLIFYLEYQLALLGAADLSWSRFLGDAYLAGSNKAITLSTVGMLAFVIGYRLVIARQRAAPRQPRLTAPRLPRRQPSRYFRALSWTSTIGLAALAGVFLVLGWRSAGEGRYTGTATDGSLVEALATGIVTLVMIIAALWVYGIAQRIRIPVGLIIGGVLAAAWGVRWLLLGDRNSLLLLALVLVAGFFTFARRAPLLVLVLLVAVGILGSTIIEVLRGATDTSQYSSLAQILGDSALPGVRESSFNITTITVRASVITVPESHDFFFGVFKLFGFLAIIPFSRSLLVEILSPEYVTSADMLGDVMLGRGASWNVGSNVISDAYLDFGVPGVIVILLIVGLVAAAIRNYAVRAPNDLHRVVVYLVALALFTEMARYTVDFPVRVLLWATVFSLVVRAISRASPRAGGRGATLG